MCLFEHGACYLHHTLRGERKGVCGTIGKPVLPPCLASVGGNSMNASAASRVLPAVPQGMIRVNVRAGHYRTSHWYNSVLHTKRQKSSPPFISDRRCHLSRIASVIYLGSPVSFISDRLQWSRSFVR